MRTATEEWLTAARGLDRGRRSPQEYSVVGTLSAADGGQRLISH